MGRRKPDVSSSDPDMMPGRQSSGLSSLEKRMSEEAEAAKQATDLFRPLGMTKARVETSRQLHGKNTANQEEKPSFICRIWEQFQDFLAMILLVSAVVSFVLAFFETPDNRMAAFVEPVVILIILILNAVVGVWQDMKAESSLDSLKEFFNVTADVIRDDVPAPLNAVELVVGDIVRVIQNCKVPADLLLLSDCSSRLEVHEEMLTGELKAVPKKPCPPEKLVKLGTVGEPCDDMADMTDTIFADGCSFLLKDDEEVDYCKFDKFRDHILRMVGFKGRLTLFFEPSDNVI